jgi:branched-chain amino acid aminotransferase
VSKADLPEPVCFCMGQLKPLSQLQVAANDLGFIHGVTVSEQVRTFRGRPFLLAEHFARWFQGLQVLNLVPPCDLDQLSKTIDDLLEHNSKLLPPESEQGICFFSTPGETSLGWHPAATPSATFSAYTYPLSSKKHQASYQTGVHLITTSIADVPTECWPKSVKIRSRLHYYLAQHEALETRPDSHPILRDQQSNVSDSAIASIVGWSQNEGLIIRPHQIRYNSTSINFLIELAKRLGVKNTERTFTVDELKQFPEALLVSTPWCLYPVSNVDETELAGKSEGFPIFKQLASEWESAVNCKFVQ